MAPHGVVGAPLFGSDFLCISMDDEAEDWWLHWRLLWRYLSHLRSD